jgi:hypothetical protein
MVLLIAGLEDETAAPERIRVESSDIKNTFFTAL